MLLTTVLMVAVAGCSNSDGGSQGTRADNVAGTGEIDAPIDACGLVTAADAAAVLGAEPVVTVEFPFRIRENRQPPGVDQPDLLGECLWRWEVPSGEEFELAQLQFTVWSGEAFYSDPPINDGAVEPLDVGDRGLIVDLPSADGGDSFLISFVVGGKTVWLDAAIWRNADGRADLIAMARRIASDLG
jgi:hypothetical protein